MNERPQPARSDEPYVLIDASGRRFVSLARYGDRRADVDTITVYETATRRSMPASVSREGVSPVVMLAAGAGGLLVLGSVLVALLLSVAIVAASLAITSLAITVCVLVLRSLAGDVGRRRRRW